MLFVNETFHKLDKCILIKVVSSNLSKFFDEFKLVKFLITDLGFLLKTVKIVNYPDLILRRVA